MGAITTGTALQRVVAGKKVAVLCWATWCPFARKFKPVWDALIKTAVETWQPLEVLLDDERNPLWAELDVEVVPTVLFFDNGRIVKRLDGKLGVGLTEQDLVSALRSSP